MTTRPHNRVGRGVLAAAKAPFGWDVDLDRVDASGPDAATQIARAVRRHGVECLPLLKRGLATGNQDAFRVAVCAFADLAPEEGTSVLLTLLTDAVADRAGSIVEGLIAMGTERSLEHAIRVLRRVRIDPERVAPHELGLLLERLVGHLRDRDVGAVIRNIDFARAVRCAGPSAGAVAFLGAVIDEAGFPGNWREEAAEMLRGISSNNDGARMSLSARAGAGVVSTFAGASAILSADPTEAYELLYERFRADREWRFSIASELDSNADPRWVDEAVRVAAEDPQAAATTLVRIATPRAMEELVQWAERAIEYDDTLKPVLEALKRRPDSRMAPTFMRWLAQVHGTARERIVLSAIAVCGTEAQCAQLRALRDSAPDPAPYERTLSAITASIARQLLVPPEPSE